MRLLAINYLGSTDDLKHTILIIIDYWLFEDMKARMAFVDVGFPIMGCEMALSRESSYAKKLVAHWGKKGVYIKPLCYAMQSWMTYIAEAHQREKSFYERVERYADTLFKRAHKDVHTVQKLRLPAPLPLKRPVQKKEPQPQPIEAAQLPTWVGAPGVNISELDVRKALLRLPVEKLLERITVQDELIRVTQDTINIGLRIFYDYTHIGGPATNLYSIYKLLQLSNEHGIL